MFINNAALFTSLYQSQKNLFVSSQRLSTSLRINSAKDDPAGLAIATRFQSRIGGIESGNKNIQGIKSHLEIADGAMSTAGEILMQMKDLATQADNDTLSTSDKQSLQNQLVLLKEEYDNLTATTKYNGNDLVNNVNTFAVNTGNGSFTVKNQNIASGGGSVDIEMLDITTSAGAQAAITKLEASINGVSGARGNIGAQLSALEHREEFNQVSSVALQSSKSRIMDADMAKEMSDFSKNQILQQTNLQMLQQLDETNQLYLMLFR